MAIQIDEKLLSIEAKQLLSNAKNKSQLLRDALEFYTKFLKGGIVTGVDPADIIDEISDIKRMISEMQNCNWINNDVKPKVSPKVNLTIDPIVKKNEYTPKAIEEKSDVVSNNNEMSEDERLEIERMLDNSLENF